MNDQIIYGLQFAYIFDIIYECFIAWCRHYKFFYVLYTTLLHIDYNRPQIHSHTNVLVLSSPCLSIMIPATMKLNDNGLAHSWNISLPYFRAFESHSKKTLNGQPFLHSLLQIQWSMKPEFKFFFFKKMLFYIFKKSVNGLLIKVSLQIKRMWHHKRWFSMCRCQATGSGGFYEYAWLVF